MNVGQPAILVPSPNVAGNHQAKNAQSLADANAAKMLDENLLKGKLSDMIESLIHDKKELRAMSRAMTELAKPEAADFIAKEIFSLIKQKQK
jgi:UDP-N-acetylglucosamine--N-acetylmuramyl-(pentapeptide) pyrophosphoryl-undecaprenol N-acetylglucosamine transferase